MHWFLSFFSFRGVEMQLWQRGSNRPFQAKALSHTGPCMQHCCNVCGSRCSSLLRDNEIRHMAQPPLLNYRMFQKTGMVSGHESNPTGAYKESEPFERTSGALPLGQFGWHADGWTRGWTVLSSLSVNKWVHGHSPRSTTAPDAAMRGREAVQAARWTQRRRGGASSRPLPLLQCRSGKQPHRQIWLLCHCRFALWHCSRRGEAPNSKFLSACAT